MFLQYHEQYSTTFSMSSSLSEVVCFQHILSTWVNALLLSFHQRDPDCFQHIPLNAGHTVPWNDKGGQTLANSCHQIISISILSIEF